MQFSFLNSYDMVPFCQTVLKIHNKKLIILLLLADVFPLE